LGWADCAPVFLSIDSIFVCGPQGRRTQNHF
jgi:hypothetical protein